MNILDFEDARERGKRRGRKAAARVINKWKQPQTEIEIGKIVNAISADQELRGMQQPEVIQEMEERYGEN